MIRLAATFFLLALAGPAAAQIAAPSGQQQFGTTNSAPAFPQGGSAGSGLDVMCNELIAGTFCTSGGSSGGGYGSPTAGTSATNPSLPPCMFGMPANELCN